MAAFRDPHSAERRDLDPPLARLSGLSPQGLAAGLETVLAGIDGAAAARLFATAPRPPAQGTLLLVILASNLPGLALQPLLPALALRRPTLLKSPSAEPLFTPAFLRALVRRQPRLAAALAAITWPGGDRALEEPLLAAASRIMAYGDDTTIADLKGRVGPRKLIAYGARASLAAAGAAVDVTSLARGLARDVALFDQRGCLSPHAVYTAGDPHRLADELARALRDLARRWPPGPLDPRLAAGVQQLRAEAAMRGLHLADLPLAAGTVVVESQVGFRPSPGLRTVRVHPLPRLDRLPELLAPWRGRLQGVALAGEEAWRLAGALHALGVSRCAPPGELQRTDASWRNGGVDPLEALAGDGSGHSAAAGLADGGTAL